MPSRGMKKLREVEKIGLVVLCIAMLATLGVGMGPALRGCGEDDSVGSFEIEGDTVTIDAATYQRYHSYLSLQNYVLRVPPPWKYAFSLRYYGIDPLFRDYQADEDDLWTFIILDHVAARSGVEIPPKAIAEWIRRQFSDRDGNYDRANYERWVRSAGSLWPTAADFEKMLGMYLRVEYFVSLYEPLLRPGTAEIYENWRFRNKRHDVRYVVQDFAPIRAELDPAEFTAEKLGEYYDQGDVKSGFLIPTKRSFEATWLIPSEISEEEFARLREVARTEELLTIGADEPFQYYYANQRDYPIEPIVEKLRKEWEEAQKKKAEEPKDGDGEDAGDAGDSGAKEGDGEAEDEGDDGEPKEDAGETEGEDAPDQPDQPDGDEDPAGGTEPVVAEGTLPPPDVFVDPTEQMEPREKFDAYFAERVERDLFVRKFLDRLLKEIRVQKNASLKDLATKYGIPYFVTEEPLGDFAIGDLENFGSTDLRLALAKYSEGRKNEFGESVVKAGRGEKTGSLVFRLLSVVGAHYPDLETPLSDDVVRRAVRSRLTGVPFGEIEKLPAREALARAFPEADLPEKEVWTTEDVLRLLYRQQRAEEIAKERLEALRDMVRGGAQTFESAAAEKGMTIRKLTGVSKETPPRTLAAAEEGETLTPEQEEKNRQVERDNFILKGRVPRRQGNMDAIDKTEALRFVEDILTDKETDAAYLVYVDAHKIPEAEEMPTVDARMLRLDLQDREKRSALRRFFDFKVLREEYRLDVPYIERREKEAAEKEAAEREAARKKAAEGQPAR